MKMIIRNIAILFSAILLVSSCMKSDIDGTFFIPIKGKKPNYPADVEQTIGVKSTIISSNSSSTVSQGGFTLNVPSGAVPKTNSGSDGKITFSVDVSNNLPAPLPASLTQGSNLVKIEPFAFTFNYPLTLNIPIRDSNLDAQQFSIYTFNEVSRRWEKVPISGLDFEKKTASISVLQGGYFIVVEENGLDESENFGGLRFVHPQDASNKYFYTYTLVEASLVNSSQKGMALGTSVRTLARDNGVPDDYTYIPDLPQGTYYFEIGREKRNSVNEAASELRKSSVRVTIDRPLLKSENKLNMKEWTNWIDFNLQALAWSDGRPSSWGEVSKTYGSGKFQATLTWVNYNGSTTDYDLHLYGPNSLHVYFSAKQSTWFELDRDWMTALGNATENIYSIRDDFPKGTYQVRVNLYSGMAGKEYNLRIIRDGVVVKSERNSNSSGEKTIYTFTIN